MLAVAGYVSNTGYQEHGNMIAAGTNDTILAVHSSGVELEARTSNWSFPMSNGVANNILPDSNAWHHARSKRAQM